MQGTKEIEFDAVAMNGEVVEYAISEHIEFAGVHPVTLPWCSGSEDLLRDSLPHQESADDRGELNISVRSSSSWRRINPS